MREALVVVMALAVSGCRSQALLSELPPPVGDSDTMWGMAPEGTTAGLVVAPGVGDRVHRALIAVFDSLRTAKIGLGPELTRWLVGVRDLGIDLKSSDGFAGVGLDPARGGALFLVNTDAYMIVPIADRSAFVGAVGGTELADLDVLAPYLVCEPGPRWYRCAPSKQKLAAWAPAPRLISEGWPSDQRGPIELYFAEAGLPPQVPLKSRLPRGGTFRLSLSPERGGLIAHAAVTSSAPDDRPELALSVGPSPTGFLHFHGTGVLGAARIVLNKALDAPLVAALSWRAVLDALTGEVVAQTTAGHGVRAQIELGIRNADPLLELTSHCTELAERLEPVVTGRSIERGCALTVRAEPLAGPIPVRLTVGNRSAVIEVGEAAAGARSPTPVPPAPRDSSTSLWMRGAMFEWARPGRLSAGPASSSRAFALWALSHLSELSMTLDQNQGELQMHVHLATTWRNPDQVVSALEPLIARLGSEPEAALAAITALAVDHPGSPLATDLKLGSSSGLIAIALALALPRSWAPRPQTTEEERRAMFKVLVKAMCNCADRACADEVDTAYSEWVERYQRFLPAGGESPDMVEAATRFAACKAAASR